MPTIEKWLQSNIQILNSSSPKLDVELLVAYVLQNNRSWIHAHAQDNLTEEQLNELKLLLGRRLQGEPLAYILGSKEFYGRDFLVNKDVLVPRPETESFVEVLRPLTLVKPPKGILHVLDMGTGSGCLAVTVKLEFPHMNVHATDTSKKALLVATDNAKKHDVSIVFKKQNLLHGDKEGYDVILANLPYVPDDMQDSSIMKEPAEALFSGPDGLNHYKELFRQLEPKHIRYVMTESLESQHQTLKKLAKSARYSHTQTQGLVQLFTKD